MFNFNDIASIAFDEATEKYQNGYDVDGDIQRLVWHVLDELYGDMGWCCDSMSVDVKDDADRPKIQVIMVGDTSFLSPEVCEYLQDVNGGITVTPHCTDGYNKVKTVVLMDGFWIEKEVA